MFGGLNFKKRGMLYSIDSYLSIGEMKLELLLVSNFELADNVQLSAISN